MTTTRLHELLTLQAAYGVTLDTGRSAEFAALFLPDGALAVGGRETTGTAALEAFARAAPRGVHLVGPPPLQGEVATSAFTFVDSGSGELLAGHYRDTVARDSSGRLVFRRRDITITARR